MDWSSAEDARRATSGMLKNFTRGGGTWDLKVRFPMTPYITVHGELHLRGTAAGELFVSASAPIVMFQGESDEV